jgi:hypothetical protein
MASLVKWHSARNVLARVNLTREELRYAKTYAPAWWSRSTATSAPRVFTKVATRSSSVDAGRERVTLENERGKQFDIQAGQAAAARRSGPLRLYEPKPLDLHQGDRIRWTDTDHKRGLINADQARIPGSIQGTDGSHLIGDRASAGKGRSDVEAARPRLRLNAHMAQGLTSDRGIAVMDSRERNLSNQQTFLVTITRLRDGLTLCSSTMRRGSRRQSERNTGMKRSALETVDLLRDAAAQGQAKGDQMDKVAGAREASRAPARSSKKSVSDASRGLEFRHVD